MQDWIFESAKLLGRWDKIAASKALTNLKQDQEKGIDEILMGYALAKRILDNVFTRFLSQKQTLSDEDAENIVLAVELARLSIPHAHPLLHSFLKDASFINDELTPEVKKLENELFKNA